MNEIKNFLLKIKKLITLGLKSKILFSSPTKKKIIVFDCESPRSLHQLFPSSKTFILTTRVEKIKELYLSFSLVKFLMINFFKRSLKLNYLIYLIIEINPKVIITLVDNSADFHIISKNLEKRFKFIALQNSTREVQWLPNKWTKKFYIPEFYSYGLWDKKLYLNKTSVKNITPKGSFEAACSLTYFKKKKVKLKKEFDLYLISEMNIGEKKYILKKKNYWKRRIQDIKDSDHIPTVNKAFSQLTKFCYRFAEENNLKIVIAGKGKKNSSYRDKEFMWFKDVLKKKKFILKARNEKNYSNYLLMLRSNVVIGRHSSLVREAIGLDKKVFWCDFTNHPDGGFPFFKNIKKFVIEENSYRVFEKKLKFILNLKKNAYFQYLNSMKNEICINSKGYDEFIFKRVNDIIQNKTKKAT